MKYVRHVVSLALTVTWLLAAPLADARDGDESGSSQQSGSIIGYQPIPSSMLSQSAGTRAPTGASYASAATMAQPGMIQAGQVPGAGVPMHPALRPGGGGYDYTTWLVGEGPYTMGRDDMITIEVRNQPEFSGNFVVGPDGSIQYNYIGDVPVLGMTKYEVQQVLTKMLDKYIRVPQVTVTIIGYNSKAVYVIGEVNRPGKYLMRGDTIKLREAIVAAGLPTRTAALWRTHIVKPDLDNPMVRKINLKKILNKGQLRNDISLYPGEIIVVPSTVLHSVNMFLSDLLNPFTRAASAASIGAGL